MEIGESWQTVLGSERGAIFYLRATQRFWNDETCWIGSADVEFTIVKNFEVVRRGDFNTLSFYFREDIARQIPTISVCENLLSPNIDSELVSK